MRAAILFGPEDLRVEQVPEPEGEVIVEVQAATTCGTDVKMWRYGHRVLGPYPCAFGHETAGVRVDTGVRVLVSDSVACGSCGPCRAGRAQICRAPTWVLGGFAERIAAPAQALHSIPDGLPAEAAAMAEPLAAAVHAVARGSDADDVGILGGGPMGLMLTALLVAQGRSVTLADPHAERRRQATDLGARATNQLDDQHELVFEAVGRPETWRAAAAAAAPGGVVVLVGGCPERDRDHPADRAAPLRGARAARDVPPRAGRGRQRARGARGQRAPVAKRCRGPTIPLEQLPAALGTPTRGPAKKWVVDPRG